MILTIISESAVSAFQQLIANRLRSALSLLGITIGIWCIIAVNSAIDSLEANIRHSFNKLGSDVVYISKMPWGEDPQQNYWKYMRRPNPSFDDYRTMVEKLNSADMVAFSLFLGVKDLSFRNQSASNVFMVGATYDYATMFSMEFSKGRYFSPNEYQQGTDVALIGDNVAESLFPYGEDPIGKKIKVAGHYMTITGVIKKSGKDLINIFNYDNAVLIGYNSARKFVNINNKEIFGGNISVKAKPGIPMWRLQDDITGTLRTARHLHPLEKDNFSLNTLSIISGVFDRFFGVMKLAGYFIGIFSIFVGMFGVANIMFVSVKERTSQIGIMKALGAPKIFILTEFLIEAVTLCIIGGLLGLLFVWLAALGATYLLHFDVFLSAGNILSGIGIAIFTGVAAGIIPAWRASRLDPVEAMRK